MNVSAIKDLHYECYEWYLKILIIIAIVTVANVTEKPSLGVAINVCKYVCNISLHGHKAMERDSVGEVTRQAVVKN